MFAGFDNLDTSNVAFVGALDRVRPERVRDLEVGGRYRTSAVDVQANVYSMNFHATTSVPTPATSPANSIPRMSGGAPGGAG